MLQRLRIKNFELLRDVEIELSPDVPTVLIGAHSPGKSTVLEVFDFLGQQARAAREEPAGDRRCAANADPGQPAGVARARSDLDRLAALIWQLHGDAA